MKLTFEDGTQEYMLPAFGWTVDKEGYVSDGKKRVKDTKGNDIKPENIAGFVRRFREPVPLRDNFCDIVDDVVYEQEIICDWE